MPSHQNLNMTLVKLTSFLFLISFCIVPFVANAQSWDKSDYAGYRCAILQFKDVHVDDQRIQFTCSLANTGRESLHFEQKASRAIIVFTADKSLGSAGLHDEMELIAQGLMTCGISLKPGEMMGAKKFEFSRSMSTQPPVTALTPAEEPVKDVSETATVPKGLTGEAKDDFIPLIDPAREGCPDLIIDSLWIVQEKRNSMHVAIRLRNQGDGSAPLYTADRADQGMGVSFYFGTTDRISRGSQFIQGVHIDGGLAASEGRLLPGASLVKEVKIDTRKHTRFLTALQCRVDTFQRVHECDESNNEFVHYLR